MPAAASSASQNTTLSARETAALAVDAALDKKARDVTVLDLREVSGETDYFVICSGESDIQIRAIADAVIQSLKGEGERPRHREGYQTASWVLLDYFDVVVHVFDTEKRAFYDLERLWGDAPREDVPEDATEVALLREDA